MDFFDVHVKPMLYVLSAKSNAKGSDSFCNSEHCVSVKHIHDLCCFSELTLMVDDLPSVSNVFVLSMEGST